MAQRQLHWPYGRKLKLKLCVYRKVVRHFGSKMRPGKERAVRHGTPTICSLSGCHNLRTSAATGIARARYKCHSYATHLQTFPNTHTAL